MATGAGEPRADRGVTAPADPVPVGHHERGSVPVAGFSERAEGPMSRVFDLWDCVCGRPLVIPRCWTAWQCGSCGHVVRGYPPRPERDLFWPLQDKGS